MKLFLVLWTHPAGFGDGHVSLGLFEGEYKEDAIRKAKRRVYVDATTEELYKHDDFEAIGLDEGFVEIRRIKSDYCDW